MRLTISNSGTSFGINIDEAAYQHYRAALGCLKNEALYARVIAQGKNVAIIRFLREEHREAGDRKFSLLSGSSNFSPRFSASWNSSSIAPLNEFPLYAFDTLEKRYKCSIDERVGVDFFKPQIVVDIQSILKRKYALTEPTKVVDNFRKFAEAMDPGGAMPCATDPEPVETLTEPTEVDAAEPSIQVISQPITENYIKLVSAPNMLLIAGGEEFSFNVPEAELLKIAAQLIKKGYSA